MTSHIASSGSRTTPGRDATRTAPRLAAAIVVGAAAVVGLTIASLFVGSGSIAPADVWGALTGDPDVPASTALIVRDFRVPRTILAILVGIGLGLAGALAQALTRNPLADPGILGVNAGAYTAVVAATAVWGVTLTTTHVWVALAGALVAAVVVYGIGSTGMAAGTPSKLVLTGVAFASVLIGLSYMVTLTRPEVFDKIRMWNAGSLQGRQMDVVWAVLPFLLVGVILALALPRALNATALGDDIAVALGSRPALTRVVGVVAITALCGAATAAAGPIIFVGLMVPHAIRSIVGPDQRRLIPLCLLAGPILLLASDIVGRVIVSSELPVGVVTAVLGAPVLIALTRRKGARGL